MPEPMLFELLLRGEVCLAVARPASPNWELYTRDAISGHQEQRLVRGPFDAILLETLKTSYFGVRAELLDPRCELRIGTAASPVRNLRLNFSTRSQLFEGLNWGMWFGELNEHQRFDSVIPRTMDYLQERASAGERLQGFSVDLRNDSEYNCTSSTPTSDSRDLRDLVRTHLETMDNESRVDVHLIFAKGDELLNRTILGITPSDFTFRLRQFGAEHPEEAELLRPLVDLSSELSGSTLNAQPQMDAPRIEPAAGEYALRGASVNCDGERLEMPGSSERVMLADVLAAAAVYADHGFFPVVRLRLGAGWGDDVTVIEFSAPKKVLVPAEFLEWAAGQDIEPEALQWIERIKPEFAPGRMPAADLAGLEGEVLVPLEVRALSGWAAALFLLVERSPGIYNAAAAFGRPGETDWESLCELARENLAAGRSAVFSTGGIRSCGETARSWVEAKLVGEEPRCQVAGDLSFPEWLSPAPLPVPHEVAELLNRLAETRIEDPELAEQVRRVAALASPARRTTRPTAVCPVPRASELPDASMLGVCAEEEPAAAHPAEEISR